MVKDQKTLHSCAFDEKMTLDPWSLGWRVPARDGRRAADDHPCSDIETSHDGVAYRTGRVVEIDVGAFGAGCIECRLEIVGLVSTAES